MKTVAVTRADGALICNASLADGFWPRVVGLLGRRSLASDGGLLLDPCSSVHTFFMRFPIDVIYLGRDNAILRAVHLPAFRFSLGGKGAARALELQAHSIDRLGLSVGETLKLEATGD